MNKRNEVTAAAFILGGVALSWAMSAPLTAQTTKGKAKDVFGLAKVHQFHLELSVKEWETLQQVKGGMNFGFGVKKAPEKPAEKVAGVHKGGSFGMEFPWAHASLTAEGQTYADVGVRYKGGGSYVTSVGKLKRNFKIEFDHYDQAGRFHGLKTISLNAGAADPTRGREGLAFAVYRAAGVPAPRTAYAEVTLTVPGKFDKELVGMYTVVEHVDKTFLKDRFKNGDGLLLKPEINAGARASALDYRGDDWEQYKAVAGAKREPTKKEAQRVIEFARLIHKADDDKFRKEVASYLDVDGFLRFLACTAFVANMDSVFTTGHNVYIYLNPKTNKFVFMPWDLDLAFAGFPMMGTPEKLMDLSLTHPYPGENKLVDRLLADKEVAARYQKLLKELAATCFSKEHLLRDIDTIEETTLALIAKEKKASEARKESGGAGFLGAAMFGKTPDLRTFVESRTKSVAAQLDGKATGFVPANLGIFLRDGKAKGPAGGFKVGEMMAGPLMTALDTDKDGKLSKDEWVASANKVFAACEKDPQGRVEQKAIAAALNAMFPKAPEGMPAPPAGFGPGNFMAPAIIKRADADKDTKLTADELLAAARTLFDECDKGRTGKLDEPAFAELLNTLFPVPNFPRPANPPAESTKGKTSN